MRQGRATVNSSGGSQKIEPRGPNYTPAVVSQIGSNLSNHATDHTRRLNPSAPMYEGKQGASAPPMKSTSHHCGSQGRH